MTKAKKPSRAAVAAVAALNTRMFHAARNEATSFADIKSMLKGKAEKDLEATRREYMAGRISVLHFAQTNDVDAARGAALALMDLKGHKSKDSERRTDAQENIVTAARMAWMRLLVAAGVKSPNAKAPKKAPPAKPAAEEAPKLAPIPVIVNAAEWATVAAAQIKAFEELLRKNAKLTVAQRKPFQHFITEAKAVLAVKA